MADDDLLWVAAETYWNNTFDNIMTDDVPSGTEDISDGKKSPETIRLGQGDKDSLPEDVNNIGTGSGNQHTEIDSTDQDSNKVAVEGKEEELLAAINEGNIGLFMEILNQKETNLEYKDSNGKTPVQVAIEQGYSGMVKHLLERGAFVGDSLLRAVDVGFDETIKVILNYCDNLATDAERLAILECHCMNDDFHPDVTPIVLAAQRNDFTIVKLLLEKNCKIPDMSKGFATTATDSLQRSVGSLELYEGLSNEAYAALATRDPVDNAFALSDRLQKLSKTDVEFKNTYLEFSDNLNHIATDIISHARDTEEILTVLSYRGGNADGQGKHNPLAKLARAITFEQKEFVAHPNCQQTVKSKFYGRMSYLLDYTAAYRLVFFLLLVASFPVLSLLHILVPVPWIKRLVECPYVRFVLQMASDIFFVLILTIDTFINGGHLTAVSFLQPTRLMLLAWILGIGWQELRIITRKGVRSLEDTNHVRDIVIVVLFLTAISLDAVEYYTTPDPNVMSPRESRTVHNSSAALNVDMILHRIPDIPISKILKNPGIGGSGTGGDVPEGQLIRNETFLQYLTTDWWNLHLLSSGLFAVATVLALLRMLPYVVVSDVIGPLQISLGTMVSQTLHFFVFIIVVFLAFGVGLTYIYSYYDEVNFQICVEINGANDCRSGDFANLFSGSVFLYWSVFGLENLSVLSLGEQAYILQFAGQMLYAMFYVLLVLILLNALIAVMSNVYNNIEENADIEWKFAIASMWMRYMSNGDVIPPPFNIIPSTERIIRLLIGIRRTCQRSTSQRLKNEARKVSRNTTASSIREKEESQYQRIISRLVERYVASKTAGEVSVEAEINIADIRALRNDLLELKYEMHQRINAATSDIDTTTTEEGALIRNNSKTANAIFGMAEQIHEEVHTELKDVTGFKRTVAEQAVTTVEEGKRLHVDWIQSLCEKDTQTEMIDHDKSTQTEISGDDGCFKTDSNGKSTQSEIHGYDECIQTEIEGHDACIQTEIEGHAECIQTEINGQDAYTQTESDQVKPKKSLKGVVLAMVTDMESRKTTTNKNLLVSERLKPFRPGP